jgi:hypothetical protein
MKKLMITSSMGLALCLFNACGSDGDAVKQNPIVSQSAVKSVEGVVLRDNQGQMNVGGVPLDTNGATLTINGRQCPMSDLQPGMTVEAKGSMGGGNGNMGGMGCGMGDNGQRFRCSNIAVNSMLTGDIESLDVGRKTLQVAGMVVLADDLTFIVRSSNGGIGAGCVPIAFGALLVGDVVNICGTLQEDGAILASRICVLPLGAAQGPSLTTQGLVAELNVEAKTFRCGGFNVHYGGASVVGALADGAVALVSGTIVNGVIDAIVVTVMDATGTKMVSGNMSGLNQGGCQFSLSGGGCCGSFNYLVDFSGAKVDIDLATHKGKVCVQGVVTQNGNKCTIKATWVTK